MKCSVGRDDKSSLEIEDRKGLRNKIRTTDGYVYAR
jgi:hypothetical protein